MFLCRARELTMLNRRFQSSDPECIVIYGRRRVGKTALITEFVKDKKCIFFPALRANAKDNLEALSKAIHLFMHPGSIAAPVYSSYDDALAEVTAVVQKERVVFVIDELPWLCEAEPSIPSRLQHLLDHEWKDSGIMLILCGSSMSFMEKEVLSEKSPLFGRRTGQIKLEPLSFMDARQFHPDLSAEENALIYGITGGIPHYIRKLNVKDSIRDALLENFFDRTAYLFEEPENLLRQELREPANYNSIITAIAGGSSRLNEIATQVRMETSECSKYLKTLISLGIIGKVTPVPKTTQRAVFYRITDPFFRFWYRFVPRNMLAIASGRMENVYSTAVEPYLNEYMGQIFETMCRSWLMEHADSLAFPIAQIGEWWGGHPKLKKEIQVDIVAASGEGNSSKGYTYLIGSCKYRNMKIGTDELELLQDYATAFATSRDHCDYWIFAKEGFTQELQLYAETGKVRLLTLKDMYQSL